MTSPITATLPTLYIFAGAGLSAPSGAGTFRDTGGFWSKFDQDKVCNIATWRENYEQHHEFYNARRVLNGQCKPNAAHYQIADWKERFRNQVKIVTTNVDDLLERAGIERADVLHLHGYIKEMVFDVGEVDERVKDIGNIEFDAIEHMDRTGEWCKPNVRLFGEIVEEYYDLNRVASGIEPHDIVLVIGCSNKVIPFHTYGHTKTRLINVNSERFSDGYYSEQRIGCASEIVPLLDELVTSHLIRKL